MTFIIIKTDKFTNKQLMNPLKFARLLQEVRSIFLCGLQRFKGNTISSKIMKAYRCRATH